MPLEFQEHGLLKSKFFIQTSIQLQLKALHISHWQETISTWLDKFEGLEIIWPAAQNELPGEQVYNALTALPTHRQLDDYTVANALADLDFVKVRIKHGATNERWNHLEISLSDFLKDSPAPIVYEWDAGWPPAQIVTTWLMTHAKDNAVRIYQQNMPKPT